MSDAASVTPDGGNSRDEQLKEAAGHLAAGRRSMLLHDYKNAVLSLETATRLFDQVRAFCAATLT